MELNHDLKTFTMNSFIKEMRQYEKIIWKKERRENLT